jgi:hypothetical protein
LRADGRGCTGLVSCFAFSNLNHCFSIGSYGGRIVIFSPENDIIFNAKAQAGGVTHIKYSDCGNYLWAGGRRSKELLCWDIRKEKSKNPVYRIPRICKSNQRIQFDVKVSDNLGHLVVSGNSESSELDFWQVGASEPKRIDVIDPGFSSILNCVHFNPVQSRLVATTTGTRFESSLFRDSDSESASSEHSLCKTAAKHSSLAVWAT